MLLRQINNCRNCINNVRSKGCIINYRHITNSGAERVNESTNYLKLSVIGVSVGAVAGTGYSLYKLNKTTTHILNEEIFISPIDNIPESIPSRQV